MLELLDVFSSLDPLVTALRAPGADPAALWEARAVQPVWPRLTRYAPMDLSARKPACIADPDALETRLRALSALDLPALKTRLCAIMADLPATDEDPLTVAIFPLDSARVREKQGGVVGCSLFGSIMISVDPLAPDWQAWLPYVFAHEYHHARWGDWWYVQHGGSLAPVFGNELVLDGEADSFALAECPDRSPAWLFDLPAAEADQLWRRTYRALCPQTQVDYARYMFGGGDVPWCAGYTMGYRLVQRYLAAHPMGFETLLRVPPEEILAVTGDSLL